MSKIAWSGTVVGVQPRIDLMRSFDEWQHNYLGYLLAVDGLADGQPRRFSVRIGPATQAKQCVRAGVRLSGLSEPVADAEREVADFYKVSALKVEAGGESAPASAPPWRGVPPSLEVYRERGHRRLDARTYAASCVACQWGCRMAVTLIVDHWNPSDRRYRFETLCYGPKSCTLHRPGPTRKVPGRKGMSWEEEDWVDEEATAHRRNRGRQTCHYCGHRPAPVPVFRSFQRLLAARPGGP